MMAGIDAIVEGDKRGKGKSMVWWKREKKKKV
jgi:hypothetical protein